ncbi:MAG TPA: LPS export ABC transporter ATP-binding protein [bacterium]|nr:LPS export ABC transporter ATP-binding protein [bacterium]HPN31479.1 LPS export ABC transporter ATP-binding protein [bacterium]
MVKLRTEELVKTYKNRDVVKGASIEIESGTTVGLLGPNGAGKTTTFYMIVGLIRPTSGYVYYEENEISRIQMFKRAKLGIGYLPQEASIFRKLTVEENIYSILQTLKLSSKERKSELDRLLEEFNITHIRKNLGYQLSGGERRRVEIARALVNKPKILLLDEPFAGVDPIRVQDIQNIVKHLKEKGIGVLITDHKVRETLEIVDVAYMMADGDVFISGNAETLAADERARRLYLGENFKLN